MVCLGAALKMLRGGKMRFGPSIFISFVCVQFPLKFSKMAILNRQKSGLSVCQLIHCVGWLY